MERIFDVCVGGGFACFTRPEFKVERVSYLVMTPSAARGLLEAIFWKPEFRWRVREIRVLNQIRQASVLRNELSDRQSERGGPRIIEDVRQQRTSLILKDVSYLIRAEINLRPWVSAPARKYTEMFQRRLERGQCHHTPYLGTREFAARFERARGDEEPIPLSVDLGRMLFEIAHRTDGKKEMEFWRHGEEGRKRVQGRAEALYFDAKLRDGVMSIPQEKYVELERLEDSDA